MHSSKRDYRNSHIDQRTVDYYENTVYGDSSSYSRIWKLEQDTLAEILKKYGVHSSTTRYLDFACGTGRLTSFIEDKVANSTGVDISQNMIDLARPKLKRTAFVVADLIANDVLSKNQYDLITAFRFFLNSQQELRKDAMSLLANKLAPEGILVYNIHGNLLSYRFFIVWLSRMMGKTLQQMTFWQSKKLATDCGLRVTDYYGIGFIPKFLYPIVPNKILYFIEKRISGTFLKYFCLNMVFVCKK